MLMSLFDSFAEFRRWFHIPNDSDHLDNIKLYPTPLETPADAQGTHTLLDHYIKIGQKGLPDIDEKRLGAMSIVDASGEYLGRLINESWNHRTIELPLTDIEAIWASRHGMQGVGSIEAFGKANYDTYRHQFEHLSEIDYFNYCLRGGFRNGGDKFRIKHWAPTMTWMNSGGSHRLSTAYYIARKEGYQAKVEGLISEFSINHDWLDQVNQTYRSYIFTCADAASTCALYEVFKVNRQDHSAIIQVHQLETLAPQEQYWPRQVFILLLNRKTRHSRATLKWIEHHRCKANVQDFHEITQAYRAIEQHSQSVIERYPG